MRGVPAALQLWQQMQRLETHLACLHLAVLRCWDQTRCLPP